MIEIGSHNNASPSQHPFHDIYLFHIDPAKSVMPFCFEQSMSGGHWEHGGERWLARWMSWMPGRESGASI
ncbi:hypothetical protein [Pseudomonas zeae]|uniref:Uncharacterized protein n=1 Tax=Pseudomonas zeae TaxID=2745510 RepID=A0ABU5BU25_9PSED|nr:hypothetical protein [Pseudomonas zeae]MDX9679727.1 hypothetical protein [Pseudomonas zeae]